MTPEKSTEYGMPLTERKQVRFTKEHLPQLKHLAAQSGMSDVTVWLRRVALGEIPHPLENHVEPSPNRIVFQVDDLTAEHLQEIAVRRGYTDGSEFLKMLVGKMVDYDDNDIDDFIVGNMEYRRLLEGIEELDKDTIETQLDTRRVLARKKRTGPTLPGLKQKVESVEKQLVSRDEMMERSRKKASKQTKAA